MTRGRDDRLTAHAYFPAALELLGERGADSMTIAALCDELAVTKGSFYHHFGGLPAFVTQLLGFWEDEHSARLIRLSRSEGDPIRRHSMLVDFAVGLPHATEAALRAWARSSPEVAEVVTRADRRRERHVTDTLVSIGLDRPHARLLSRLALDALLGQQLRERPLSRTRLRRSLDELSRMVFAEAGLVYGG